VINEETGILVPPADPQRLADAIDFLLKNNELRNKLVHNAKRHINENHTLSAMVSGHMEIFHRLLERKTTKKYENTSNNW